MQHILSRATPLSIGELRLHIKIFHDEVLNNFKTKEHEHPFYEFSFMNRGHCRYLVNEQSFLISSENKKIVFVPSTTPHIRGADDINGITLAHLSIEAASAPGRVILRKFRQELKKGNNGFQRTPELDNAIKQLRTIMEKRNSLWTERAENKLKEFFLIFFSTYFSEFFSGDIPVSIRQSNETIEQIVKTVDEMLNIHANALQHAQRIGLSERHISRLLKAEFGMPLGKYIVHKQMEAAKQMLTGAMNSVKDTAGTLGFVDTSHFCRVFRLHTGLTPKQYSRSTSEK